MDYSRAFHKTIRESISTITEMRGPTLRLAQKIPQGLDKTTFSILESSHQFSRNGVILL
jgi:hypothetical protein